MSVNFRLTAGLSILLVSLSCHALPVKWDLSSVSYADSLFSSSSGKLGGYFTYDADTNAYSDYDITVGEMSFTGNGCTNSSIDEHRCDGSSNIFSVYYPVGPAVIPDEDPFVDSAFSIHFIFRNGISNAGGTESLVFVDPYTPDTYGSGLINCDPQEGCGGDGDSMNKVFYGPIVGTVVPVPAAIWLLISALSGLSLLRRKQPLKLN